jgi:hypothetical protein
MHRTAKDGEQLINPSGYALARLQCGSRQKTVNGKTVYEKQEFPTEFKQVRSKPHAQWGE